MSFTVIKDEPIASFPFQIGEQLPSPVKGDDLPITVEQVGIIEFTDLFKLEYLQKYFLGQTSPVSFSHGFRDMHALYDAAIGKRMEHDFISSREMISFVTIILANVPKKLRYFGDFWYPKLSIAIVDRVPEYLLNPRARTVSYEPAVTKGLAVGAFGMSTGRANVPVLRGVSIGGLYQELSPNMIPASSLKLNVQPALYHSGSYQDESALGTLIAQVGLDSLQGGRADNNS